MANEEAVPVIGKEELKLRMDRGSVTVVDVLSRKSFDDLHIKGSIWIPFDQIEMNGWEILDRKKAVVTYCANYNCSASKRAAAIIALHGYEVFAYEGGIQEWADSGLPVEGRLEGKRDMYHSVH